MQSKNRKLIIGVIIIGAFISSLNQTVMTASLPRIMVEFDIGAGIGQWLTTAYLLFLGVMIPCTGYLMEKFSAKKLYLASIFLFLAGCGAAAFANSFFMLLAGRIIQALGAGILLPLPQVVTFRLYEPDRRGAIMGIVGLTTGFAPAFGPTFAGWVVDAFGWRMIFYIMCALSLLSILLALLKMPDESMSSDSRLDILSVVLSTLGFSGLLTAATDFGNYGFTSWLTWAPLLAGAVCIVLFTLRQFKISDPLLNLSVFENRDFTFGTVLLVFAYGSMLSVSTLLPIYIQSLRGFSATVSGLTMLPGALFLAFLNPVTGRILDKRGPFLLTVAGLAFLGGGTLALSFIGESTSLLFITVFYGLRMLGIVALLQPLMTWSVNALADAEVAHGTAIMNTVRQVGGAIMSAAFVTVMSSVSTVGGDLRGIQASFLATAAVVFICVVVVLLFMRPRAQKAAPVEAAAVTQSSTHHLIITISRQYGSGGLEIGQRVGQALGIAVYDKELLALEARESGFSPDYIANHEEELTAQSLLYDFSEKNYEAFEQNLFCANKMSVLDSLFSAQRRVIKALAQRESCVIIGRCADDILRDDPYCLRVFVHAGTAFKKDRIVTEYGLAPENALAAAKKKDRDRAAHYRRYTGKAWGVPANYQLVLDSGALGIEAVISLIVKAANFIKP